MLESNIPGSLKPYVEVLQTLDGHGQLWAADGQFLGLLSSNQRDQDSIINSKGRYGSPYSSTSIRNPKSLYGGTCGTYSPYNTSCINPPVIFYRGQEALLVTRNLGLPTQGLPILDPDLMLTIYEQVASMPDSPLTLLELPTSTFNLANIPNPSGQWIYVTTDATSGDEIAVDFDSGIQQGKFVRFWQRRIFTIPNEQGAKLVLFYLAMDCTTGGHRIEKEIYLNNSGMVVAESTKPGPLQYVMPDSVAVAVFQCVCPLC